MRVRHVQGAFWGASRTTLGGTILSASRRVRLCPPHGGFVGPAHALWILRYWPRLNEGVDAPNRNLAFWHVRLLNVENRARGPIWTAIMLCRRLRKEINLPARRAELKAIIENTPPLETCDLTSQPPGNR